MITENSNGGKHRPDKSSGEIAAEIRLRDQIIESMIFVIERMKHLDSDDPDLTSLQAVLEMLNAKRAQLIIELARKSTEKPDE